MVYLIFAILMFGFLVATHELGHFLAAKACGVRVEEYAIGMGPALFKHTRGETQYSLRLFPVGGFCAMTGEDEESDDPRALTRQVWWKQLIIFVAGAAMNLLTGFLIVVCLYASAQGFYIDAVGGTAPETQYDLQYGDILYSVNGYRTYLAGDASMYLTYGGDTVELEVVRDGTRHSVTLTRQNCTDSDGGSYYGYGIYIGRDVVMAQDIGTRLRYSWYQTLDYVQVVWFSLQMLVTGQAGTDDLSGPVGIVSSIKEIGEETEQTDGFAAALRTVLYFAALIAVNLCVMNLLPLPALDGGKVLFLLLNTALYALFKKQIPAKYQAYVDAAGLVLLLGLMLFVTFNDVMKLV